MTVPSRKLHSRWKDPRLALGVALVALSAAGGGMLFSGPRTVQVYQAKAALLPGTSLEEASLALVDIDPSLAGAYAGPEERTKDAVVADTVHKGELVARTSLLDGAQDTGTRVVLPLAAAVPSGIDAGDTVSLWAVGRANAAGAEASAKELTAQALFVSASAAEGMSLGGYSAELQIPADIAGQVLAVTGADATFMVTAGGAR